MKLIHYPTYVQCPVCKKSFKTDLYLKRHIMSSHDMSKYNNYQNTDGNQGSLTASYTNNYRVKNDDNQNVYNQLNFLTQF